MLSACVLCSVGARVKPAAGGAPPCPQVGVAAVRGGLDLHAPVVPARHWAGRGQGRGLLQGPWRGGGTWNLREE